MLWCSVRIHASPLYISRKRCLCVVTPLRTNLSVQFRMDKSTENMVIKRVTFPSSFRITVPLGGWLLRPPALPNAHHLEKTILISVLLEEIITRTLFFGTIYPELDEKAVFFF